MPNISPRISFIIVPMALTVQSTSPLLTGCSPTARDGGRGSESAGGRQPGIRGSSGAGRPTSPSAPHHCPGHVQPLTALAFVQLDLGSPLQAFLLNVKKASTHRLRNAPSIFLGGLALRLAYRDRDGTDVGSHYDRPF